MQRSAFVLPSVTCLDNSESPIAFSWRGEVLDAAARSPLPLEAALVEVDHQHAAATRSAAIEPIDGDTVVLYRAMQSAAAAGTARWNGREVDLRGIDILVAGAVDVVNAARMICFSMSITH